MKNKQKIYTKTQYADVTSFKFTLHALILGGEPTGVRKISITIPENMKDTEEEKNWIDLCNEFTELLKDCYLKGSYKTKAKVPSDVKKLRIRNSKEAYYYFKSENGNYIEKR